MTHSQTERERLIKIIEERDEFVTFEDGYIYWWPEVKAVKHSDGTFTSGSGGFSSAMLRIIADELDKRNAAWDAEITAYFEQNSSPPADPGSGPPKAG